jgi:uncharacterized protein (TIGR00730 family)
MNKQETHLKSVVVYCASSNKVREVYFEHARLLGRTLAEHKIAIRYGGGNSGLMGELAQSAHKHGGDVIGVIPKFMIDHGWNMDTQDLKELVITETMHERKKSLMENVDAAIALPGSVGTFEELIEVICWKKLGLFTKPIIIVNIEGYYNDMLRMFDKSVEENFMTKDCANLWTVVESGGQEVIDAILKTPDTNPGDTFVHELVYKL